ncbi:MAG: hypothetical protein CO137_02150 [Candidatus Magasanikbacteria bacterium CG_4_9_14_3_um_filter_32_9]|uniref:Dihydrofolate reductase n=1 Tax=Candidatus Magasanikbacteria bacterium CG_4_9_14_3_um_filter_32_9 TaxID=1974644 RepID=A0A2M7Z6Q1_9BACT|nr:MAG: hypothetical protein CO137_02150 [Candidatus Magasanikbacteria bacterium CG_4_9_14_3_um_filter_32_9]
MISIIVAISENNCIGVKGALPWNLPKDLKHFKDLTSGKVVIMGRKTWESLPEKFRPLPNRKNVVITQQENYKTPENVEVFTDISNALKAHENEDVFIIGGGQIYNQTIDLVDTLHITKVHQTVDACDTFFPKIDEIKWNIINQEDFEKFSFLTYKK